MTKRILQILLAAALLLPTASRGARLGVSGGPSYGTMNYEDPLWFWRDTRAAWGFSMGAHVEVGVGSVVSIVPELRFVRLQNRVELDPNVIRGHFNLRLDYASLPLFLRFGPASGVVFLEAGGEVGLLLKARSFDHADYSSEIHTDEFAQVEREDDITDQLERRNVSLAVGAGMNLGRWSVPISFRIRYMHGLTNVGKEGRWLSNWTTQEISTMVVYVFDL